jgi:hypothetical protein
MNQSEERRIELKAHRQVCPPHVRHITTKEIRGWITAVLVPRADTPNHIHLVVVRVLNKSNVVVVWRAFTESMFDDEIRTPSSRRVACSTSMRFLTSCGNSPVPRPQALGTFCSGHASCMHSSGHRSDSVRFCSEVQRHSWGGTEQVQNQVGI